jgi:hypothetical protein
MRRRNARAEAPRRARRRRQPHEAPENKRLQQRMEIHQHWNGGSASLTFNAFGNDPKSPKTGNMGGAGGGADTHHEQRRMEHHQR